MTSVTARAHSLRQRGVFGANASDRVFRWGLFVFAASVLAIIVVLGYELAYASLPSLRHFGWRFLITSRWDPVHSVFGALPFIYGTLVSSFLALLMAVPIGLGAAVFLAELSPRWLRGPVSFLVELLAAVPSIVYGLWGIFVLLPALRPVQVWLGQHLGFLPLFQGPAYGIGMMAAGLILAIMVIPFITAVSREVLQAVPASQRDAAYALGATRWEALKGPVFRYARAGILGAIILGLGRAVGETMAVTMVIGNRPEISFSLFSPSYTLASALANEFLEATVQIHTSALLELALILFAITIVINAVARAMLWSVSRGMAQGVRE